MSRLPDSWLDVRLYCTASTKEVATADEAAPLVARGHAASDGGVAATLQSAVVPQQGRTADRQQYSLASPFFLKPRCVLGVWHALITADLLWFNRQCSGQSMLRMACFDGIAPCNLAGEV